MPKTKPVRSHPFTASRFNPSLCIYCACTEGKPWHTPDPRTVLETTDAPPYETTSRIPKKRTDQQYDNGQIRSAALGTDASG